MFLQANIKGYINGHERGIYSRLMTYSELSSLSSADDVNAELSLNPSGYYQSLNADGHIDQNGYIIDGSGNKTIWQQSGGTLSDGNYYFVYNSGSWNPEYKFMTYSELSSLSSADDVNAELSLNPSGYYQSLNADGHIDQNGYIIDGSGNKTIWQQSGGTLSDGNYYFVYNSGSWNSEYIPPLKTYSELVALNNYVYIIDELNSYPVEYYDYLNSTGHIIASSMYQGDYEMSNNGSRTVVNGYYYIYSSQYQTRTYNQAGGPE